MTAYCVPSRAARSSDSTFGLSSAAGGRTYGRSGAQSPAKDRRETGDIGRPNMWALLCAPRVTRFSGCERGVPPLPSPAAAGCVRKAAFLVTQKALFVGRVSVRYPVQIHHGKPFWKTVGKKDRTGRKESGTQRRSRGRSLPRSSAARVGTAAVCRPPRFGCGCEERGCTLTTD